MYRQILIHPNDRYLQMNVWRDSSDKPIDMYTLNTVTYGTTSTSYYFGHTLFETIRLQYKQQYPIASDVLLNGLCRRSNNRVRN